MTKNFLSWQISDWNGSNEFDEKKNSNYVKAPPPTMQWVRNKPVPDRILPRSIIFPPFYIGLFVHTGYKCDGCGQDPIRGGRFTCLECSDDGDAIGKKHAFKK